MFNYIYFLYYDLNGQRRYLSSYGAWQNINEEDFSPRAFSDLNEVRSRLMQMLKMDSLPRGDQKIFVLEHRVLLSPSNSEVVKHMAVTRESTFSIRYTGE